MPVGSSPNQIPITPQKNIIANGQSCRATKDKLARDLRIKIIGVTRNKSSKGRGIHSKGANADMKGINNK